MIRNAGTVCILISSRRLVALLCLRFLLLLRQQFCLQEILRMLS
jgi:hypothetical protein